MKGPKIRTTTDPAQAREFAAGATVILIQRTLHRTYGVVNFIWPRYWRYHYGEWQRCHAGLQAVDQELLQVPVDETGQRLVLDDDLIQRMYTTGVSLVVNAILTVHHLLLEVERVTGLATQPHEELSKRLGVTLRHIGFRDLTGHSGWEALIEVHKYRDAVCHPKPENTLGGDDGSWAQVPLAWFGSGRALATSTAALAFVDDIASFWEENKARYDRPGTLTVKRGLRSLEPVKKPPPST